MAGPSAQPDENLGRVQIRFNEEDHGSMVKGELPFIIGVVAPLSGSKKADKPLEDRQFEQVDRSNIDTVMKAIGPTAMVRVPDTTRADGTLIELELTFSSREDFKPGRVAESVPALREKLQQRRELQDLLHTVVNKKRSFLPGLEDIIRATIEDRTQAPR